MTLLRSSPFAFVLAALLAAPAAAQEPPPAPTLVAPAEQAAPAEPATPAPAGQAQQAFPTAQPEPADPAASTTEAEDLGLTGEEVQDSQPAPPTDQGTLRPEVVEGEEAPELYALLQRVRQAPPGLDGKPIPRPNPLASEPTTEMTPLQPEDPSLFPEGYVE